MSIKKPIKRIIKKGLQSLAARLGRHTKTPSTPQLLVLMYHRILPVNDPRTRLEEPGMWVSPESFRDNLLILSQYFDFIKLSEWIERKNQGLPLPLKACAITFDDGWADNYEYGFPILKELEIPATIFLVSDMINTTKVFWPERLANCLNEISQKCPENWSDPDLKWLQEAHTSYLFSNLPPSTEETSQIIAYAKKITDTELHQWLDKVEKKFNINTKIGSPLLLDWEHVNQMIDSGLIEMGSHTCNHIRLNRQSNTESITKEIVNSKTNIENATKKAVSLFCFPNGDYSTEALNLVKQNYSGSVTTDTGWNTDKTNNYLLKRIGIHEDIAADKTAFLARISNWL